ARERHPAFGETRPAEAARRLEVQLVRPAPQLDGGVPQRPVAAGDAFLEMDLRIAHDDAAEIARRAALPAGLEQALDERAEGAAVAALEGVEDVALAPVDAEAQALHRKIARRDLEVLERAGGQAHRRLRHRQKLPPLPIVQA